MEEARLLGSCLCRNRETYVHVARKGRSRPLPSSHLEEEPPEAYLSAHSHRSDFDLGAAGREWIRKVHIRIIFL